MTDLIGSLSRRTPRVAVLAFLILTVGACSSRELTRDKAEALLRKEHEESFAASCALNRALAKKPEFRELTETTFCDVQPMVTGIRKESDTEAEVEWKPVTKARASSLRAWLRAMDRLESRLLALRPQKLFTTWIFRDPSDDHIFMYRGSGQPENISFRDTWEWEQMNSLKQSVSALADKGQREGYSRHSTFRLYDDGWRLHASNPGHDIGCC